MIASKKSYDKKNVQVDGVEVEITWKKFFPQKESAIPNKIVLFFPGWSISVSATSLTELNQAFSDYSRRSTYFITTRTKQIISDSLHRESKAVLDLLKEEHIEEVILAGYSEGAIKAIDIAHLLKEEKNMLVNGIILMDAVGLYKQDDFELAWDFVIDTIFFAPLDVIKRMFIEPSIVIRGLETLKDILVGIAHELWLSKLSYVARLRSDVRQMANAHPWSKEIGVPIVIVQGVSDIVSQYRKIIPGNIHDIINSSLDKVGKEKPKMIMYNETREQAIKEKFFPKSKDVSLLLSKGIGHHGLPFFRSKLVARVSLSFLDLE